jgi:Spy/CpxP family protein refolding chaperone
VTAQLDLIIAARGKLDKANALMMLAIRRTLTPEQWRKLQSLQQEREGTRGRPGEEPPGRHAPPGPRRGSVDAPPPR